MAACPRSPPRRLRLILSLALTRARTLALARARALSLQPYSPSPNQVASNYDSLATVEAQGACTYVRAGCTDSLYSDYVASANAMQASHAARG